MFLMFYLALPSVMILINHFFCSRAVLGVETRFRAEIHLVPVRSLSEKVPWQPEEAGPQL